MKETFLKLIEAQCSRSISREIVNLDYTANESTNSYTKIFQRTFLNDSCLAAFVGFSSYSISEISPRSLIAIYLQSALSIPPNSYKIAPAILTAYSKFEYDADISRSYFRVLGKFKIDLREKFDEYFYQSSFQSPDSEAFNYFYYLTVLNDPRGSEEFEKVTLLIEDDPHKLVTMLIPLVEARKPSLRGIFTKYINDARRGIGVDGPGTGPSVQEIARLGLEGLS